MEQPQPADGAELTTRGPLAPFGRRLLGATVTGLWRVVTVSDDGVIPLLGELALETDTGFVQLSYTQDGLAYAGPVRRTEIRWSTESDLAMDRSRQAEEWLDLVPLTERSSLPLTVETLTGWFGTGTYLDAFAIILTGGDRELVIMTTDEFDLLPATRRQARERAELVAANLNLVDHELRR